MNWQYISGFFDGDGSITLVKNHSNQQRSAQISFSNNEKYILEDIKLFIEKEIGIRGTITTKKVYKNTHSTNYELSYHYLPKAMQIGNKLELKHQKKIKRFAILPEIHALTPRNGKYTKEMLNKRDKLVTKFFSF